MFNCTDSSLIIRGNNSVSSSNAVYNSIGNDVSRGVKVNYYVPNIKCYESVHIVHLCFGGLFVIIFIILCTIITMTLFNSGINSRLPSYKISCNFDKVLLVIKTMLCFVFCFSFKQNNTWFYIPFLCIFSIILLYIYSQTKPYLNPMINLVYYLSMALFAWASIALLLCKLLEGTYFNGGIALFFIGIPVTFITLLSNSFNQLNILLTKSNKFTKGEEAINQIRLFLYIMNNKENSRRWKILLKGYAYEFEATCQLVACPLKKYIFSLEKGIETNAFLFQHVEDLFQISLRKFPFCTLLRIAYSFFLIEYLNQKQQAIQELLKAENNSPSFDEQFIIYRFKRLIEEQLTDMNEAEDNRELVISNTYKKYFVSYKQNINKVSQNYIEFWTLLLNQSQNQEQLIQLNDCGTQIQEQVKEINNLFQKMQKIKANDQEVIYYYFDFFNDILNDKVKANYYLAMLNQIEETKQLIDDTYLFNLDINGLTSSDEYQYIILSGRREDFGIITHISFGVCSLLGYYKEELIGKAYEILMPEIYHKMHRRILNDKVIVFKKEMTDLSSDGVYKPNFKEISSFARNKARYLVPVTIKVALISTELNGISFIAKLIKENVDTSNSQNSVCHIITNNMLIIQNFTANAVNMLKINSNVMNKTIDLASFIKQFHEEYLKIIIEKDEISLEQKISIKRQIINSKFRFPVLITWKLIDTVDIKYRSTKFVESQISSSVDLTKLNKVIPQETLISLSVQDAIIGGKQEGYIFKFGTITSHYSINLSQINQQLIGSSFHSIKDNNSQSKSNINPSHINNLTVPKAAKKSNKEVIGEIQFDQFKTNVPEGNAIFNINTKNMSYVKNIKENSKLKEDIRNRAFQIIKQKMNQNSTTEEKSGSKSSGTFFSESESEFESSENIPNNNILKIEEPKLKKNSSYNLTARMNEEYYKVSMTNIKYSIYSFKKKMTIEVPNYSKKSQVEMKMYDNENEEKTFKTKKSVKEKDKTKEDEYNEIVDNEGILTKQIDQALAKEEKQITIVRLKWITLFTYIVAVAFDITWGIMILFWNNKINENYFLIKNSSSIIINSLFTQSNIRDLTLLSHNNYTNIFHSNEKATQLLLDEMVELFHQSHEHNVAIITSPHSFSNKNKKEIINKTIRMTVIKDDLAVFTYNMTLSSAFIEMNTAAFHITKNKTNFYPTNKYIFFYLYNLNNEIYNGLRKQEALFIDEFGIMIKSSKLFFIIMMVIVYIVFIVFYFLFVKVYNEVVKKKDSYLAAFLEIEPEFIRTSLRKCEQFNKKMQSDSFSEFLTSEDLDHEENPVEISPIRKRKSNIQVENNSKESILIKLSLALFLGFTIILSALDFILYTLFLNQLNIYIEIMNSQNEVLLEHLVVYRNLREFVFDDTAIVNEESIGSYFPQYILSFFSGLFKKMTTFLSYRERFPGSYADLYTKLYHNELCDILEVSLSNCKSSLYQSSQYGLTILLSVFVEEIRQIKNIELGFKRKAALFGYKYNLTLNGLDIYFDCFPDNPDDDYFSLSPIQLFNHFTYQKIKYIYDFFLKPAIHLLFEELSKCFEQFIIFYTIIFFSVNLLYFVFASGVYLIVWKPYENRLNKIIYQTKNMLGIIPKEILLTISNIVNLLNINQSFNKGGRAERK